MTKPESGSLTLLSPVERERLLAAVRAGATRREMLGFLPPLASRRASAAR